MKSFFQAALLAVVALSFSNTAKSDTKATGHIEVGAGRAYPQRQLTEWLTPGPSYRLSLFGGAKLNIPVVSAAGIGLDFTYSTFTIKDVPGSHYRKYLWDMFFIPISLWIFEFTPGLAWVATDIQDPSNGINAVQIRPAGVATFGLKLGIIPNMAITADIRAERVLSAKEKRDDLTYENVTGDFITGLGGLMFYF